MIEDSHMPQGFAVYVGVAAAYVWLVLLIVVNLMFQWVPISGSRTGTILELIGAFLGVAGFLNRERLETIQDYVRGPYLHRLIGALEARLGAIRQAAIKAGQIWVRILRSRLFTFLVAVILLIFALVFHARARSYQWVGVYPNAYQSRTFWWMDGFAAVFLAMGLYYAFTAVFYKQDSFRQGTAVGLASLLEQQGGSLIIGCMYTVVMVIPGLIGAILIVLIAITSAALLIFSFVVVGLLIFSSGLLGLLILLVPYLILDRATSTLVSGKDDGLWEERRTLVVSAAFVTIIGLLIQALE